MYIYIYVCGHFRVVAQLIQYLYWEYSTKVNDMSWPHPSSLLNVTVAHSNYIPKPAILLVVFHALGPVHVFHIQVYRLGGVFSAVDLFSVELWMLVAP